MEWNQINSNGAIAPSQSQQYSLPSTSTMVANGQNQLSSVQQHSIVQNRSFNANKDPLLQNLLQAKTNEDFLKVQKAALGNYRRMKPNQPTSQMKSNFHISSFKLSKEAVPLSDNRSAAQSTVGSNYRMPTYVNTVHQTPQQPSAVAIGQQFGNGYNTTAVQQPLQNSQALQSYQPTVTYTYPQQNALYNSVWPPANTVQMPCQQMAPNVPPSNMYSLQNDASGQFITSQKLPAETNISAPMQNCRNNQNFTSQSLGNYSSLAPSMLPHASQQQMNVPQLQTLPPLDGNANCYTQNQQRQNFQNVLINNPPQISSAAAVKLPPTYNQATNSPPNVFNTSVSQNFSKQRHNYVASNIQQPAQTGNHLSVQSSIGDEQSRASQDRKQDMLKLLLIYRNVRQKYELLNQENNLLRHRLQASTSQENAEPPPLLSSLQTAQPQANCVMAVQQNVTQAVLVQNLAQINSTRDFHSQNVISAPNQAGTQYNLSIQENASVLNQMLKSDNGSLLGQNHSIFDGQANVANESNPALQSLSSETLTSEVCQDVTSREFRGQTNSDNLYVANPNFNNGNVLQNGHVLHSLDNQSLNSACPENNGYGQVPPFTGLTENGEATSPSREAIEASLPLWKTVSQSTNGSSETQDNRSLVVSPLATLRLLDEITLVPTNEVALTIPVPKPDSAIPNQANPQIAIVSPLVQSKEALHKNYQLSKVHIQESDVESTTLNGLINTRESECFNKILQALESLGANTLNNKESTRSKEPADANQDNLDSSLPASTEASSHAELDTSSENIEFADGLKISGICTLVEGSSFYNSSVAMMFETSDTKALPHTDTGNDHSNPVDASFILKAPASTSPKEVAIAVKSEAVDEDDKVTVGQSMKGDLNCNKIPCNAKQADQCIVSAQPESCDLESNAICDQLTELLTEFPYGIKNYMSKNVLENTNGPLGKTSDKPILKVSAAPKDFEPVEGKAISDTQSEMVPTPSENFQHVVEMDSEPLVDIRPSAEKLPSASPTPEKELIPDKHDDENSIPAMNTCSDDDFEILSNSPVSDIHITLLDQDEIPKIFPDEYIESEKCNETKLEVLQESIKIEEPKTESHTIKKDSIDATESGTDKNLFCCLFSWLTLTNKNAPKCNCKQLESSKEVESSKLSNNDSVLILKTEPSLQGLPKPNVDIIGLEILQPNDRPPKLDLVDSDGEEIQQPMDKPPKLERIVSEAELVQISSPNVTPQPERGLKRSTSVDDFQSVKDGLKQNHLKHEKSLTPSYGNREPTFRNSKDQSSNKLKFYGSRKPEKLIVKTDFLKNKHPYKRRKSEQKNAANVAQPNKNESQNGASNNSPGKPERRAKEEKVEQNMSNIRVEQSPKQQADMSWNRKSSRGVDKSSHSRGAKKRKEKESHFEKTRKVPSVQEYLERKRELCKKKTDARTEPREDLGDERHTVERPSDVSGNPHLDVKRPLSPVKMNVTSKENGYSKTPKGYRKDYPQSRGPYEAGRRKRKDLHNVQRVPENKTQNLDCSSSKNKIYLSPCDSSRRASYEGINLAKLQIRHSPDKPKHIERRKTLGDSLSKHSNSAEKNIDSPKMLEFKLYPEFAHGSPTSQDKAREAVDPKEKSVVEGIKISKEAWCNSIPFKKRKVENVEGLHKSPSSAGSTLTYKPLEKTITRQPQDSRTTFNVFKQMYHEQRSKSLDLSQSN
ncbi:retroelement silencing factor 1 [Mantella aurantiaca]